jgi:hypothetical protein
VGDSQLSLEPHGVKGAALSSAGIFALGLIRESPGTLASCYHSSCSWKPVDACSLNNASPSLQARHCSLECCWKETWGRGTQRGKLGTAYSSEPCTCPVTALSQKGSYHFATTSQASSLSPFHPSRLFFPVFMPVGGRQAGWLACR